MTSEENRRKLSLGGGKYILGAKMRAGDEVTKEVLARQGRYHQVRDNLRVKEVIVGDGERRRRYVVCHNPDEATRQQEHRRKLVAHVEAEIATMKAGSGKHSTGSARCSPAVATGATCARPPAASSASTAPLSPRPRATTASG